MKFLNINFLNKKNKTINEKSNGKKYDRYSEIGKLVKEARIQKNLSIKELSHISKIPESSKFNREKYQRT